MNKRPTSSVIYCPAHVPDTDFNTGFLTQSAKENISPRSPVSPYLVTNGAKCDVRITVPHSLQLFFGEREDLMLIIRLELVIANTMKTPECFVFLNKWKKQNNLTGSL